MLRKIYIKNYVLIEELSIDFDAGYQVITGETGSGKSIFLDAFALTVGARFDKTSILNHDEKCVIEVEFDVASNSYIQSLLNEFQLDTLPILTIRRELTLPSARTRSFMNDSPCTLEQIQKVAVHLVDLHRQFDHMNLFRSFFELETMDSMSGTTNLRQAYQVKFTHLKMLKTRYEELNVLLIKHKEDYDYWQHIAEEIRQIDIKPEEVEQLEVEEKQLQSAEQLFQSLYDISVTLDESETSILSTMSTLSKNLEHVADVHTETQKLLERFESACIELKDIALTSSKLKESFQADGQRLQQVQERLSAIYTLLKKHQVRSIEDLICYVDEVEKKMDTQLKWEEEIHQIRAESRELQASLSKLAATISEKRQQTALTVDEEMNVLLQQVGMQQAQWKSKVEKTAELNMYGRDTVQFLIDINNTSVFNPVSKVASGGELSRIMLCLKTIFAQHVDLPCMIFDEIDVGINGEVAKNIARLLDNLGKEKQIICITHQPNVVAAADTHYFVYKSNQEEKTKTYITKLSDAKRVGVLATMLDGNDPSTTSLLHAEEMLKNKTKK